MQRGLIPMKKIIIIGLVAMLAVAMSACGSSTGERPEVASQASMAVTEVQDNLDGLCKYLAGNGILVGDPLNMEAELIGAKEGRKYSFQYEKSAVEAELYEYDLGHLNDTAKAVLQSVREKGSFEVLGQEVEATLSNSGKYLMIYLDPKGSEEARLAHTQKAKQLFQEFKEGASDTQSSAVESSPVESTPAASSEVASSETPSTPAESSAAPTPTQSSQA